MVLMVCCREFYQRDLYRIPELSLGICGQRHLFVVFLRIPEGITILEKDESVMF